MNLADIGLNEPREITITRQEADFDRACDEAFRLAVSIFAVDEYGHSSRVEGWQRSTCSVQIEHTGYRRIACQHHYRFLITAVCEEGK